MHASILLGVAAVAGSAAAQGINSELIYSARPKYRTVTDNPKSPDPTIAVQSILAKMKAAKSGGGGSVVDSAKPSTTAATIKTTAKTTALVKTTAKATTKKTTTTSVKKPKTTTPAKKVVTTAKTKAPTTVKKHVKRATTTSAVATSACSAQPFQYAYTPANGTAAGWLLDSTLAAQNAAVNWPAGYSTSFTGKYGSVVGSGYIGYYQLPYYDVRLCQERCDNEFKCSSFNIYFERDPKLDPGVSCPNPTAGTNVVCTLYSDSQLYSTNAFNIGQWRTNFQVVISGSNSYYQDVVPGRVDGFRPAQQIAGAVNVTTLNGKTVAIGSTFNSGSAFAPTTCAKQCGEMTAFNKQRAINAGVNAYTACNYANAFGVSYSGSYLGTYCQFYTTQDVVGYGYQGFYQTTLNGASYDISTSYGYAAIPQDSGLVDSTNSSTSTVSASYTKPFYIQVVNSNYPLITGSYLMLVPNATTMDQGTYTKNLTLATKFIIDTNTNTMYEYNTDPGYVMAFPSLTSLTKHTHYSTEANIPTLGKKGTCSWNVSGNYIICTAGSVFMPALACTGDSTYLYWNTVATSSCGQVGLVPIAVSS